MELDVGICIRKVKQYNWKRCRKCRKISTGGGLDSTTVQKFKSAKVENVKEK